MGGCAIRWLPRCYRLSCQEHRNGTSRCPQLQETKVYDFGLHEIDDLFTAMFAASSINPSFVGGGYTRTALPELYATENQHMMPDRFGSAQLLPTLPDDPAD